MVLEGGEGRRRASEGGGRERRREEGGGEWGRAGTERSSERGRRNTGGAPERRCGRKRVRKVDGAVGYGKNGGHGKGSAKGDGMKTQIGVGKGIAEVLFPLCERRRAGLSAA